MGTAHQTTAEAACRAFRSIADEEDHLAIAVYHGAHAAHLDAYGNSNPNGAALARTKTLGLWSRIQG